MFSKAQRCKDIVWMYGICKNYKKKPFFLVDNMISETSTKKRDSIYSTSLDVVQNKGIEVSGGKWD